MTVQDFIHVDVDTLPPPELAIISEHALCDEVPCEYCLKWTPRQHEWHDYITGSVEVCFACQKQLEAMLGQLIERRAMPPWSNMRVIYFRSKVISVGLGRLLKRHLIRMVFEDFFECQRMVGKWL